MGIFEVVIFVQILDAVIFMYILCVLLFMHIERPSADADPNPERICQML